MKVDLTRLKLRPRESESFCLEAKGQDELLQDLGGKFLNKITVELVVENTGRLFIGHGKVETLVQLPCSRCLKDFSYPISANIELSMVPVSKAQSFSEDDDYIFFDGDAADISSRVLEAIYMAIPIIPLCQEDCRGLCSICGTDKNTGDCSCSDQDIDPRWEKLKNL